MNNNINFYKVGFLKSTHGINGYIVVKLLVDINLNEFIGKNLFILINDIYKPVEIEKIFVKQNDFVIKFKEFNNIDNVKQYIKSSIFLSMIDINDSSFVIEKNIIGYDVIDNQNQQIIGKIISVEHYKKNKLLSFCDLIQNKNILVPFVDEFVVNINHDLRQVSLNLIKGL